MVTIITKTLNLILFTHLYLSTSIFAHEKLQTNDHQEVLSKVLHYETISKGKNLVVFDIDNTLIATSSDIGSDQWFEWQTQLIATNNPQYRISSTIEELIILNTKIKSLATERLTQEDLPSIIQALRIKRIPVILLTSRGPELRDVTEAALKNNGLWMSDLSFSIGMINRFTPPGAKNETSFMNGIFMTAGMHKGEALKYILQYTSKKFENIVFVDDHERHTNRVFETFSVQAVPDITTYRYGREDSRVLMFKSKNKSTLHEQFIKFMSITDQVFGKNSIQGINRNPSKVTTSTTGGFQGSRGY
jgi:hypothetical protein